MAPPTSLSALAVPLDIEPMEAKLVEELPEGDWQYEPKWDGFRCLAFKAGGEVDLKAKSGKPLARYFPEMVATLKSLKARSFVLDGELVIVRDGELSFDALLQRIHPAESRIKRLAAETPAIFILFDMASPMMQMSKAGSQLPKGMGRARTTVSTRSATPIRRSPVQERSAGSRGRNSSSARSR